MNSSDISSNFSQCVIGNSSNETTTKIVLTASLQDHRGRPVAECLAIVVFAVARDAGSGNGYLQGYKAVVITGTIRCVKF